MAGDWIKMRTDLYRDPKVCAIADALMHQHGELAAYVNQNCQREMTVTRNVMRNVTVGALVSVWGVMRLRGKRINDDLVLKGSTLWIIDDLSELPGFGQALASVGWIEASEEGLVFPNFFSEYNVDPNEEANVKNAERQRRYREKAKEKSNVTQDVTNASQSNAREEKRREEKSNTNTPLPPKGEEATPPFVLPDWINAKHWDTWHSTPKRKKATTAQKQMAVDKLDAWRMANEDYAGALENAAIGGNQGLFLPNKPTTHAAPPETFKERDARLAREKWERMTGEQHPDNNPAAPSRSILDVVDVEMKMIGAMQ